MQPAQFEVVSDIIGCRTEWLGGHTDFQKDSISEKQDTCVQNPGVEEKKAIQTTT